MGKRYILTYDISNDENRDEFRGLIEDDGWQEKQQSVYEKFLDEEEVEAEQSTLALNAMIADIESGGADSIIMFRAPGIHTICASKKSRLKAKK